MLTSHIAQIKNTAKCGVFIMSFSYFIKGTRYMNPLTYL